MNAQLKVAPARHPRYVHVNFQNYLRNQGLPATQRKRYAAWLCRFIVFHHGRAPEQLSAHHVEHFLQFITVFGQDDEPSLQDAHCCLRMFYQRFLPKLAQHSA
ncbi:MAG: phage integrase N-terminal SAM-like domain-containing protein [Pseudomonadales bacterium]